MVDSHRGWTHYHKEVKEILKNGMGEESALPWSNAEQIE